MIEGFWIVQAEGKQGSTGGVAVFTNGRIYGGDSGFFYIGTYEGDRIIKARVAVHNFDPSVQNILSVAKDYELHITATLDGDTIKGTAIVPDIPNQSMALRLTKKANL